MDKIQILKMLLEACGNAGEGAAKLAILYFSMELLKFVLLLALWVALAAMAYKFLRYVVAVINPPSFEQTLLVTVRDDLLPSQKGSHVSDWERQCVHSALIDAWNKRPKT